MAAGGVPEVRGREKERKSTTKQKRKTEEQKTKRETKNERQRCAAPERGTTGEKDRPDQSEGESTG
jgi:hypothetical protein